MKQRLISFIFQYWRFVRDIRTALLILFPSALRRDQQLYKEDDQ